MSNLRIKYKKLKREHEALKNIALPTRIPYISSVKHANKIGVTRVVNPAYMHFDDFHDYAIVIDEGAADEIGKYMLDNGYIEKDVKGNIIRYTAYVMKKEDE